MTKTMKKLKMIWYILTGKSVLYNCVIETNDKNDLLIDSKSSDQALLLVGITFRNVYTFYFNGEKYIADQEGSIKKQSNVTPFLKVVK